MPIPSDIPGILSAFGLPAGAIALAVGLVRGAKALEEDASEPALKYVSGLLTSGGVTNVGKVGATLIPALFDRIFGSRPFSIKFISRSILATTLFWIILISVKHPNWSYVWSDLAKDWRGKIAIAITWYPLDWLSLTKAKLLIKLMSRKYAVVSTLLFFVLDVTASFLLPLIVTIILFAVIIFAGGQQFRNGYPNKLIDYYITLKPISEYIFMKSDITLNNVIVPSTVFTSVWTFILFFSSVIAQLLIPLDHMRRFTAWWFRDVEKHPLTAIAKVAGTLIIIGAAVIKAVHWAVA